MSLFLRTFAGMPKLRNKSFGDGREFIQRANLVETEKGHGSVFEFRFEEADGHLAQSVIVPLSIDSFTILKEKKKMGDGAEYERLYLGLDSRGEYAPIKSGDVPPRLGVEPWEGEPEALQYGDRVVYRQRVQLFDLDTLDGFPFELTSNEPGAVLRSGQVYQLGARNFAQAAYGGIRIDGKSVFAPVPPKKATA